MTSGTGSPWPPTEGQDPWQSAQGQGSWQPGQGQPGQGQGSWQPGQGQVTWQGGQQGQGPWQPQPGVPWGTASPKKPWRWILYVGAPVLALVIVVTVLVVALKPNNSAGLNGTGVKGASPANLLAQLTHDLQTKNENHFLSLVAPAAKRAVQSWWANQQALGFTTGSINPAYPGENLSDPDGDLFMAVRAGTHNQFDPMMANAPNTPAVVCENYVIGIHFSSKTAGVITSWRPMGNAPWDQGTPLYVHRAAHVVVAGTQNDQALVDQTVPMAETAAEYDLRFVHNTNPGMKLPSGFVLFVSSNAKTRGSWFRTGPQPKGWIGDNFGGVTYPQYGPGKSKFPDLTKHDTADLDGPAGARVVIVPYQQAGGETAHGETQVLVHEFVHALLLPYDPYAMAESLVPAWANEGIARAIEDLYAANPNPVLRTYSFHVLKDDVQALPASYKSGKLPTDDQIYHGSAEAGTKWYDVGASVYAYIALNYGMNQLVASAVWIGENDTDPTGNVMKSMTKSKIYFYSGDTIVNGWGSWIQKQ